MSSFKSHSLDEIPEALQSVRKDNTLSTHIERILSITHLAENLKDILRHGWTKSNRQESVADHSWRLALLVILCAPYLDHKIDSHKAVRMAIIHDLVEAESGDQHFLIDDNELIQKQKRKEENAILKIRDCLKDSAGEDLFSIWHEFNDLSSYEAKFVRALDKIEGYIQQNEADISTWTQSETLSIFYYLDEYCDFDSFLKKLKNQIIFDSLEKLKNNKIDFENLLCELMEKKITISPIIEKKLKDLENEV